MTPAPDWWQDLAGLRDLLETAGVILIAWWSYLAKRSAGEAHGAASNAHDAARGALAEVRNSHQTNIREDIDQLQHGLTELRRMLKTSTRRLERDVYRHDHELGRLNDLAAASGRPSDPGA